MSIVKHCNSFHDSLDQETFIEVEMRKLLDWLEHFESLLPQESLDIEQYHSLSTDVHNFSAQALYSLRAYLNSRTSLVDIHVGCYFMEKGLGNFLPL